MLRWAYSLQRFKQWADLKTGQVQLPSLVNPCHAPGRFDATVVPAPQVTVWALPSHQIEMGRACTALLEARSEWAQQSDQSRELKCGNQISTLLPVSWLRIRAVVGGGGVNSELSHCLAFSPFLQGSDWFHSPLPSGKLSRCKETTHGKKGKLFFVCCALGIVNEPLMSTSFYILGCISFL